MAVSSTIEKHGDETEQNRQRCQKDCHTVRCPKLDGRVDICVLVDWQRHVDGLWCSYGGIVWSVVRISTIIGDGESVELTEEVKSSSG